ncbi:MAG: hypothetical protein ACE5I9_05390 [Candidatus Methylomirabilales bacterium]
MNTAWIVITAILSVAVLYVLLPLVVHTFLRYRTRKLLRCPETGSEAEVGVDASRAALTSAFGRPLLRVMNCSLWPERKECAQACLGVPQQEMQESLPPAAHRRS